MSAAGSDQERTSLSVAPTEVGVLGAELRRLRRKAGLSQEQLAERAGVSVRTILALEQGRRRQPHPYTLGALADALGLAPEDRAALLASVDRDAPLAPAAATPTPRLPVWPTSLVGREADVRAVRVLLDPRGSGVRLLSLLGPGGVGKTRLAVAAAAELAAAYIDGVAFIDLAPVREPGLVPATFSARRADRSADRRETVRRHPEHG